MLQRDAEVLRGQPPRDLVIVLMRVLDGLAAGGLLLWLWRHLRGLFDTGSANRFRFVCAESEPNLSGRFSFFGASYPVVLSFGVTAL